MPFVSVRIVREALGDDAEQKKKNAAKAIAQTLAKAADVPLSDVWVVFEEVAARDWYLGAQNVQDLRFGGDVSLPLVGRD